MTRAIAPAGVPRKGLTRRLIAWLLSHVAGKWRTNDDGAAEGAFACEIPPPPQSTSVVTTRHQIVRDWWSGKCPNKPADLIGLALSGGGIRSATFSLGVAQAFARKGSFETIDVLSTVSGGSYIGCFLRSLYLPQRLRGIGKPINGDEPDAPDSDFEEQRKFAEAALKSAAGVKEIAGPGGVGLVRNPIWWLREHSRYLAPNGPGDFSYAAAYLARNWIAMIWVFSVAISLPLALSSWLEASVGQKNLAWAWSQVGIEHSAATAGTAPASVNCEIKRSPSNPRAGIVCSPAVVRPKAPFQPPSPLLLLALLPTVLGLGVSTAYWLTVGMSSNEPNFDKQRHNFIRMFAFVVLIGGVVLALITAPEWLSSWYLVPPISPIARLVVWVTLAVALLELAMGAFYFTLVHSRLCKYSKQPHGDASSSQGPEPIKALAPELLTSELRLVLTHRQAWLFNLAGLLVALGIIETLAAWLRQDFWHRSEPSSWTVQLGSLGALPLVAFVLKKIQDWTRDGKAQSKLLQITTRFLPTVTLAVGMLLYGAVASAVDAVVLAATWSGPAWASDPDPITFGTMTIVLIALALLTGRSSGFINLSSWHNLYSSRLTRAYLGGTNVDRLRSVVDDGAPDSTIRDNHALDYIQPSIYAHTPLHAPLHIINMTVNRTVSPRSQFAARDRRGEPASVEPHGVQIGMEENTTHAPTLLRWAQIGDANIAERLSLGQWCAISGAAVSTGMGRRTNTGFSLLTSFANIRLGYWWWAPGLVRKVERSATAMALPTFTYLKNELTARYSRNYDRQYLSDGGHFENTGAYHLLKRRVPLVIVSDNGEDADYTFSDLENLVRVVRLDLELEMRLLGGPALASFMHRVGCQAADVFVDSEAQPDWKAGMKTGNTAGFALAFQVCGADSVITDLVLIKPRLVRGAPEDVLGFARANPDFPQQTTGDQFFGEAQWESYRCLGETLASRLLEACPKLLPVRV